MEKRTKEGMKKKAEYNKKYLKENMKPMVVNLNKNVYKDIIDFLDKKENKNKYLKELIRKDMEEQTKWAIKKDKPYDLPFLWGIKPSH